MSADPFTPVEGGGVQPLDSSFADSKLYRVGIRLSSLLPRLPKPVLNRLIASGQKSTRPSAKAVGAATIVEALGGGVPVTWLAPELAANGVIVFLHGGSYTGGPFATQWAWLLEVQRRAGIAAVMVLYRMPPNHPFPAALDDAVAAIRGMRESNELVEGRWLLGGDSAGGGLALAVAQAMRDAGDHLPAGLMLTAPWADLTLEHPDLLATPHQELLGGRAVLRWSAELYANGTPVDDPRLSPINGSMVGLPPVHINVGTRDLFLADIRRLRGALKAADVDVTSIEQEGGTHTYPQRVTTHEAEWTIRSQVQWVRSRISADT